MDKNVLYILIVALFFILLVLIAALLYIVFYLIKKPKEVIVQTQSAPIEIKDVKKVEEKIVENTYICHNHPDLPSVGGCGICEKTFCKNCLIEHDELHFCVEHYPLFASNKWKNITYEKTTPDKPETASYIYDFKHLIWEKRNIPSYVVTHYKINIEHDQIESFVKLYVPEEMSEILATEITK